MIIKLAAKILRISVLHSEEWSLLVSAPTIQCGDWGLSWEALSGTSNNPEKQIMLENKNIEIQIAFSSIKTTNSEDGISLSYIEKKEMPDYVFSSTSTGNYIALNVNYVHPYYSLDGELSEHIHSDYLLTSDSQFNPESSVESICIHVAELKEWVANCFLWVDKPESGEMQSRYKQVNKSEYITLLDTDDSSVCIKRETSDYLTNSTCWTEEYSIVIEPKGEISCAEVSERYILPSLSFLSFCLGTKAHLDSVYLKLKNSDKRLQFFAANTVSYYGQCSNNSFHHTRFSLWEVADVELDFVRPWFSEQNNLSVAISLIVPLLEEKHQDPLFEFMIASSALEAIERHAISKKLVSDEEFRTKFERITRVAKQEFSDEVGKKLKTHLRQGNHKGQKQIHRELVEKYNMFSTWLFSNPSVFVKLHTDNRNNVFHANASKGKNILSSADMSIHTDALIVFCYGLIAIVLGVPEDRVISSFKNTNTIWITQSGYRRLCEQYSD